MAIPTIVPMLSYEDVAAAGDWLCAAFGFTETLRIEEAGRVTHLELRYGDGVVMAGWPGRQYQSPRHHGQECETAARWLAAPFIVDGVHVRVEGIDAHCERARRRRCDDPHPDRGQP